MVVIIDFTVELNVETATATTYRNFIEDIRRRLQYRVNDRPILSHDRPLLCPKQTEPEHWFEVVLTTNTPGRALRVRVRSDNIYVDGYRRDSNTEWNEFKNDENKKFFGDNGRLMKFDCGYPSMQNFAKKPRTQIPLGRTPLQNAVNSLVDYDTADDAGRAEGLIVIVQMLSEAIRFLAITDFVVTNWTNGARPTEVITALENGWQDISTALVQQDNDSYGRFRFHDNDMGITSAVQAVAVIAILLYYAVPRPSTNSRPKRSADEDILNAGHVGVLQGVLSLGGFPGAALLANLSERPEQPEAQGASQNPGRRLVEVFWVSIDNIDGENPGDLYGTIKVSDGLSTQTLYDCAKSDHQSIKPGEYVKLTGPSRVISAAGDFLIDLDLYDHDADPSPDDEISKGQISWNVADPYKKYDTFQTVRIGGQYGAVTINYVVMTDACEASIEVILIEGDGGNLANVYGSITASNGFGERQLFQTSSSDRVDVKPGNHIPLQRNVMAVSRTNELKIEADLWDHNTLLPDSRIGNGSVIFEPQIATSSSKIIAGVYGRVEVRITWF